MAFAAVFGSESPRGLRMRFPGTDVPISSRNCDGDSADDIYALG